MIGLLKIGDPNWDLLAHFMVIFFYTFFEFLLLFLKKEVNFCDLLLKSQNFIFSLYLQDDPNVFSLKNSAGVDSVSLSPPLYIHMHACMYACMHVGF